MNRTARQGTVAAALAANEIDAIVVTDLVNVRYLCGYVGSNGTLLIGPQRRVLLTDFRYLAAAKTQTEGVDVVEAGRDLNGKIAEILDEMAPAGRVGFEASDVTVARLAKLTEAAAGITLVPTTGVVEAVRIRKEPDEIAVLAEASRIADLAFAACADGLFRGRTEREVAWELQGIMRAGGADGASFDIIVASGERGARPHAVPSGERIPANTLVTVDMGAALDGYVSDCTRAFATGPLPDALATAYAVCAEAQAKAVAALAPGITGRALDAVARDHIAAAGLGEHFRHGLGHGVGMEVHEGPTARPESTDTLEPGMTITVEPGIYLEGVGGCRIEDLCVVTDDGHRVLTGFTKDLLTVDS